MKKNKTNDQFFAAPCCLNVYYVSRPQRALRILRSVRLSVCLSHALSSQRYSLDIEHNQETLYWKSEPTIVSVAVQPPEVSETTAEHIVSPLSGRHFGLFTVRV